MFGYSSCHLVSFVGLVRRGSYMEELDPDRSGTISFEEFRDSWLSRTDNGNPDNAVADTVARASKQAAKQSKLDQAALNSSS